MNTQKMRAESVASCFAMELNWAGAYGLRLRTGTDADGMIFYDIEGPGGEWLAQVGWDDLEEKWVVVSE